MVGARLKSLCGKSFTVNGVVKKLGRRVRVREN